MSFEPYEMLKSENYLEDAADAVIMEPKNRCSLSKISTSVNADPISRALGIPEVLTTIVKHLPAGDLINFRRVCKLWYENCDPPTFVFRPLQLSYHEKVAAVLLNSSCRIMKLEFLEYNLRDFPVDTWKICGRKIRSLHLHHCFYDFETIHSIIFYCIALEELRICQLPCFFPFEVSPLLRLEYFTERRTRLRAFAVKLLSITNVEEFLKKIFTVFPCIEDLSCTVYYGDEASCLTSRRIYDFDLRKLKSFTMVSEKDYLWSKDPAVPILDYQLLRLKKFKTALFLEDFSAGLTEKKSALFQFFNVQKDLEVIDIQINVKNYPREMEVFNEVFTKELLFHVLKTCLNLREFQLLGKYGCIKLASKESEEFVSLISKLQCLKLSYVLESVHLEGQLSNQMDIPSSLPTLSSSVLRVNTPETYFFSVIKLSTRLKHLYIDVYSDAQLREIIVALTNLKTLIIRLHGCTDHGFIGENEESSIKRLQRLEYLYIIDCEQKITKKIFDEFCFPQLEFLGLTLYDEHSLPKTLSGMPALKTLKVRLINNYCWPTESVFKFYKSLRNLKYLIADEAFYLDETLALKMFNWHPNLKFITIWGNSHVISYTFSRITAEIDYYLLNHPEDSENKFFGEIDGNPS